MGSIEKVESFIVACAFMAFPILCGLSYALDWNVMAQLILTVQCVAELWILSAMISAIAQGKP